jgi:hypothetical protein
MHSAGKSADATHRAEPESLPTLATLVVAEK